MYDGEPRAPRPIRGDPNSKRVQLKLTPGEWRQLRARAAEDGLTVEEVLERLVRGVLDELPRPTY